MKRAKEIGPFAPISARIIWISSEFATPLFGLWIFGRIAPKLSLQVYSSFLRPRMSVSFLTSTFPHRYRRPWYARPQFYLPALIVLLAIIFGAIYFGIVSSELKAEATTYDLSKL